jgi:UDP-3-O-[3-hydroxymyristoyl] glucosamine N-acyltransferase
LFDKGSDFGTGISEFAFISENSTIGKNVDIGTFTHISDGVEVGDNSTIGSQVFLGENVKIGRFAKIYPGVKIYHGSEIGDHVIIHANAVIGSDGFGFSPQKDGSFSKIPQSGIVIIGNNVEIGANTVIDRATFDATIIEDGVKLDNLIQVAHNVHIGANTVIAAQSGLSGSVHLGKNCLVGGQVAFVPHIEVADGSQFQGQSGVGSSITQPNGKYFGTPAIGFVDYIKSYSVFKLLPMLEKKISMLEKELESIKNEQNGKQKIN